MAGAVGQAPPAGLPTPTRATFSILLRCPGICHGKPSAAACTLSLGGEKGRQLQLRAVRTQRISSPTAVPLLCLVRAMATLPSASASCVGEREREADRVGSEGPPAKPPSPV